MGFFSFGKRKKEKAEQAEQSGKIEKAEPIQKEEERVKPEKAEPIQPETVKAAEPQKIEAVPAAQPVDKPIDKPVDKPAEKPGKKGLFSRLWQGLTKTRDNIAGRVDELVHTTEKIDDDFYEDLVDILIMSDMGASLSDRVIEELKKRVKAQGIRDAAKARDLLKEILKERVDKPVKPLEFPAVMLVVGVNGVGKTTTIGKLAMRFKGENHSVVLAAADTFRAAAADQLEIWAQRANVSLVRHAEGADPAAVVFDGVQKAQAQEAELLIVDTAGRLHNKKNLMEELRKIYRVIEREQEGVDVRTLLVIDATTGQNGLAQAREFSEVTPVSGIVLTKLDGTAKGGIAFAIVEALNVPVMYIGVGEGIEDLQTFDPAAFVDAIF